MRGQAYARDRMMNIEVHNFQNVWVHIFPRAARWHDAGCVKAYRKEPRELSIRHALANLEELRARAAELVRARRTGSTEGVIRWSNARHNSLKAHRKIDFARSCSGH
jgi:hypothetical protein